MHTFDPAAATAAYLATFPAEAHARAVAYTHGGQWMLLWGWLVAIAIAAVVLRTGVLVRIRRRIEGARRRPWLATLGVIAIASLLETVLSFAWTAYADWWREKQYGLSNQDFGAWFGERATGFGLSFIMGLVVISLLYALIRRAPRTWWAWGGGLSAALIVGLIVISPIVIEPIFNTYTPAPPGPVRDAVVRMAEANGVPSDKIYVYDGSRQSDRYTANVSGLFGSARVAMSDAMFRKGADLAEVKAVVGHEMGHFAHRHVLWTAGVFALLAVLAFWLADRLFPLAALLGAEGVTGIADPAGWPVLTALLATISLLATPFINTLIRMEETDADRFSLERVREPDGLAKALVKTIEYRAASPGAVEEILFYDHPSVERRIRRAMDWKAANPDG
ncbi:MAG TPA: M48 family metallopeptidase [Caulobacteraceae bacterium]|jgi:STE24 endopeptidase